MKSLMNNVLVVTILSCAQLASGQEKEIQKAEYYAETPDIFALMSIESVRATKIGEYFKNGTVYKTEKLVEETLPPGRMRAFEETSEGKQKTTKEAIQVYGRSFCKDGSKPWKEIDYLCVGFGAAGVNARSEMKFYKASVDLDGKKAIRYRFVAKEPRRPNTPSDFPDVFEYITWVDTNGRLLREDRITSIASTGAKVYHAKETYEYAPKNLKIEAPIK